MSDRGEVLLMQAIKSVEVQSWVDVPTQKRTDVQIMSATDHGSKQLAAMHLKHR